MPKKQILVNKSEASWNVCPQSNFSSKYSINETERKTHIKSDTKNAVGIFEDMVKQILRIFVSRRCVEEGPQWQTMKKTLHWFDAQYSIQLVSRPSQPRVHPFTRTLAFVAQSPELWLKYEHLSNYTYTVRARHDVHTITITIESLSDRRRFCSCRCHWWYHCVCGTASSSFLRAIVLGLLSKACGIVHYTSVSLCVLLKRNEWRIRGGERVGCSKCGPLIAYTWLSITTTTTTGRSAKSERVFIHERSWKWKPRKLMIAVCGLARMGRVGIDGTGWEKKQNLSLALWNISISLSLLIVSKLTKGERLQYL